MPINTVGILTLLIAFLNVVLGLIVFVKNPKKSNNIVYAIGVFSIAGWIITTYCYNNNVGVSFGLDPVKWLKIVYLASYGILLSNMLLAYFFPRRIKDNFILYMIPVLITLIPSIYVLLIQDSVVESAQYYPEKFVSIAQMGSGYIIYTIPNILGMFLLSIYFMNKSKKFVGYEKAQIQFYILGALCFLVPLISIDYIIPLVNGNTRYFVYGPLFAIPFSSLVAYSILENRFATISNILRKITNFILDYIFVIFTVLAYIFCIKNGYLEMEISFTLFIFVGIVLVTYIFIYKPSVTKILNEIFEDREKKQELITSFNQVNNMELTMDRITINIKRTVKQIFNIERVGLILYDKDSNLVYTEYSDFGDLKITELLENIRYWDDTSPSTILISDEIKRRMIFNEEDFPDRLHKVIETMDESNISAFLPFNSRTKLNGVLLIGYRADKYPLTRDDIKILEDIMSNVSLSVARALLYQEVQSFTETLQQKVDEQTKELQVKIKELEEARKKERDMIDIMGHELRTPATIVKLNAELLNKYTDQNPEDFKKYLDRIRNSVENEIKLINTLLTSAKLEGNKVELNEAIVDIREEIEMVMHSYEPVIKEKGLELKTDIQEDIPNTLSDKVRTMEVIDNLVGNAVKYTEQGAVTIKAEKANDDFIRVSIIDTGEGMPEDEISKIGQKFHRVGHYTSRSNDPNSHVDVVRPGGTGLGLFVVFGLVKLMGGEIHIDSKLGEGSTFSFTLPIYKGEKIETKKETNNMFERLGLRH